MKHSLTVSFALLFAAMLSAAPSGEEVYKARCAACHDQNSAAHSAARCLAETVLRAYSAHAGLRTDDEHRLSTEARRTRGRRQLSGCGGRRSSRLRRISVPPASIRWQARARATGMAGAPRIDNTRYVSGDKAGLSIGQLSKLKLKWAFGFPGDVIAFGAPTVFNGTVFTGSASGVIYALDAQTGCTHWTFEANGPVRSAIRRGPQRSADGADFRRSNRLGVCAGCGHRAGRSGARASRITRPRVSPARPSSTTAWSTFRPLRGKRRRSARRAIPVLHFSRQPHGAARERRFDGVEIVHGRPAGEDRRHEDWAPLPMGRRAPASGRPRPSMPSAACCM